MHSPFILCSSFRAILIVNQPCNSSTLESPCEHIILDADFTFASEDMDIELTILSTDQGVHVPDARVTVSRGLLAGKLRVDVEPLPNFPFIGNATVGFHSLPG